MSSDKTLSSTLSQVSIKAKLEAILLLILVLSGIITSVVLYREHVRGLQTEIIQIHKTTARLFQRLIESDAEGLGRALVGFSYDESLIQLFQQQQREALLNRMSPAFEDLHREHNVTQVNFIDPVGIIFLRLYAPEQHGDQLELETFKKAARREELACGIEMGKIFFSLRCVHPIRKEGQLIGFLEIAEEIDHIFRQLKETTGDAFGLFLSPDFHARNPSLTGHGQINDFTLLYSDNPELMKDLLSDFDFSSGLESNADQVIETGDQHYALGITPFRDIAGKKVGVLVSLSNITSYYADAYRDLQINIATLLLIIAGAFTLFVIAIKRAFEMLENQLVVRASQIEHMAFHDDLTNLPNRAMFNKLIKQHISEAKRYKRRFSLLFIDLDGFKAINDSLGHEAGDLLLNEVAQRIKASLRQSDIISRMGGDEFIALLPETGNEKADDERPETAAERILENVGRSYILFNQEVWITTSIGISSYPENGEQARELTKHADAAMYVAKRSGKNKAQRYYDHLSNTYFERLALEADLRRALEKGEFEIFYQAKLDTLTDTVIGMEALIRWNHPQQGMIFPDRFIGIAEETGLIVPIGLWVIRTACEQNMAWRAQGLPAMTLTVNLSPNQLLSPHLVDDVVRILAETGMPATDLMADISERILLQNLDRIKETLFGLKKLGVHVAIDDLGVGYSSFAATGGFPVDTLKIDRSFTRGLPGNNSHKAIVEAIIGLGQKLGLAVYAEGVETSEQMLYLQASACTDLQGFYFNKPMPAEQFRDYVSRHSSLKTIESCHGY